MKRYLDPKADLTFKKIFGEHKDLVISFLNALLPLGESNQVESIEYLPSELVPENPLRKFSIVDVRCMNSNGRQFIVEMQMVWSSEFKSRVLFNASKAYVRQLQKGGFYEYLQPVYSLNLVNEVFEPDVEDFYHSYQMVHEMHSDKVIEGLHLVFVELPKFKPQTIAEKKMMVLWLRFMTEIDESTTSVPEELLDSPQLKKALEVVEESAYTNAELAGYDKFWDIIRVERSLVNTAEKRGLAKGRAEGVAEARLLIAKKLLGMGMTVTQVAEATQLTEEEVLKAKE